MENLFDNGRSSERPKRSAEKPDGNPAALERTTMRRMKKMTGEQREGMETVKGRSNNA